MERKVWAVYAISPSTSELVALSTSMTAPSEGDAVDEARKDASLAEYFRDEKWKFFAVDMCPSSSLGDVYVQLRGCLDRAGLVRGEQLPYILVFRNSWLRRTKGSSSKIR